MRVIGVFLVALALIGAGGVSCAEPTGKVHKGDKAQERLEIITMWKMMEALDLDKATADKILEIRQKFLAKRKELHSALTQDMKALKQKLDQTAAADDKELARHLADIRDKRKKLMELWDLQYDQVSKILTTRQQAELVIFLKEFRKDLRSILRPGNGAGEGPERLDHDPHAMGRPNGPPPPPRGPHDPSNLGPED
jgi:Skp family chaperone for outer membrane proteins